MNDTIINDNQLQASKIYDGFLNALCFPEIFSKEAVQIVINTLKKDIAKDYSSEEEAVAKSMMQHFINYLETFK